MLGRGRGPELDRVLESEEDIRSQDTDHCKYKYIMLSNGIKVTHYTCYCFVIHK